jgi:hypothetical protein
MPSIYLTPTGLNPADFAAPPPSRCITMYLMASMIRLSDGPCFTVGGRHRQNDPGRRFWTDGRTPRMA